MDFGNNVSIGPDAEAGHVLDRLRDLEATIKVGNVTRIVEGATIDVDPETVARGRVTAAPGELFTLSLETSGAAPRWSSFVLRLGTVDLARAGAICLIARSSASETMTMRPCLRSHREGGFDDVFLTKRMVAFAGPSTHVDAIDLAAGQIPLERRPRELILFFDPPRFELTLLDLRLAIV